LDQQRASGHVPGLQAGFWEAGLQTWDMAAGALLIQEAGGLVTDFDGESAHLDSGRVVAAPPKLFAQLLPIVQKHMRAR
ncbi:MAG: hypothetical protein H2060_11450, partial [Azoarcus sp.]|nr:hypothetical protein [Azoarcus sp.]